MSELLPCPFCGYKRVHINEYGSFIGRRGLSYRITCGGCYVTTSRAETAEQAEKLWNTRTEPKENSNEQQS